MKPVETKKIKEYPLRSIYFYLTESCNLRCIHCWIRPAFAPNDSIYKTQNTENLSVDMMGQVVQEALPLGLTHIKFTGGEPFLNPEIFTYLDRFSKYGVSFSFETNGTLLTKGMIKRLKRYNITKISVSLDGSSPQVHENIRGVKGSFERVIKGIQILVEHRIYPQAIFCLQRLNVKDLENTIRLSNQLKIRSFEINPLALCEEKKPHVTGCEKLSVDELLMIEKRVEGEFKDAYPDMHIDLYLPPALKGMKELSLCAICTCNILNICGILSNGDVSICGIGRTARNLIVGNVKENGIAYLWKEGAIFQEIRAKIPSLLTGICGKCLFKYHCLGFCRADVLSQGQSLSDPYCICEEVFQKGLFPGSRILEEKNFPKPRKAMEYESILSTTESNP